MNYCSVFGEVGTKVISKKNIDIDEDDIFDTSANNNNIPVDYSNPGSKVTITPTQIPSTGISLIMFVTSIPSFIIICFTSSLSSASILYFISF